MNLRVSNSEKASVLIIVLWVSIGLVSIALYFGHAMSSELQASANTVAATEADMAIEGAARYVSNVLANAQPGYIPENLHCTNIAIGNAHFWIIGRATNNLLTTLQEPAWGLVDEAAKININATAVTKTVLTNVPNLTSDIADAIIDWRSTTSSNTSISANYSTMQTSAYTSKHAPFNTIDELRLVTGMDLATLYGEDANLNGFLDPNEDDADNLPPFDNHDGHLDSGLLEYLTIYSREPNTDTNGALRVNITTRAQQAQLRTLLQQQSIPQSKMNSVLAQSLASSNVLEMYIRNVNVNQLSELDFAAIEPSITTSSSNFLYGLVNINTASEQVLACIPGIGSNNAPAIVSYRESNPSRINSIAWLAHAMNLTPQTARTIGQYITSRSYQFTADIAAVGEYGRGYKRIKFVFDTSEGLPKIIYRQDLTHLGWALGPQAREVASTL
ncbi:MAG: ral secretion pathway protein [Verrucomicrobiales bacterium]|nr:ral secretion pathway protein [Verrucomicrobiales bacterium]